MKRIKIMQLLTPLNVAGAERVVLMIERYIDKTHFDLSLCLFLDSKDCNNPFVEEVSKSGINITKIFFNKALDWKQVKRLVDILSQKRLDILHTHSHRADILGYLANKFWNAKLISTLHGFTPVNMKMKIYEKIDIFFLRRFDSVIAVSRDIKKKLESRKVSPSKITFVQNALNFSCYSRDANGMTFRDEYGLRREDIVVGTVARLSSEKGVKYLLLSARKILSQKNNVKFVVVGDGPEKNSLLKLRNQLGLNEDVIFTGYRADISSVYQALDIFVLPSLTEGLPISLLEAAYFKKPIIATRVGGIPDLFKTNFIFVNPGRESELTVKILYLLNKPEEASRYGNIMKEIVMNNCDPQKWAATMQRIYIDLMS